MINTELNQNFPSELLEDCRSKGHFGGEFIFDKMNLWKS